MGAEVEETCKRRRRTWGPPKPLDTQHPGWALSGRLHVGCDLRSFGPANGYLPEKELNVTVSLEWPEQVGIRSWGQSPSLV